MSTRPRPDSELAARGVQELAAVPDAELAAHARSAAADVFACVDQLVAAKAWPASDVDRHAYAAVQHARAAMAALPGDADLKALAAAVAPLLNQWSPHRQGMLHEAVQRLREVAIARPALVEQCRWVLDV